MSVTILRINAAELVVVRLVCSKCGAALESQVDNLDRAPESCPICRESWMPLTPNALRQLKEALHSLTTCARLLRVEFDLPESSAVKGK